MAKHNRPKRVVRETVLLVVEGYAEQYLLQQIRALYTSNRAGHALTLRNAKGKGAANVIDYAVRLQAYADYTTTAALFDTDTDWSQAVRKHADQHKIVLLKSEPCLEAWLLDAAGYPKNGTTQQHKARFQAKFNGDANNPGLIEKHFPRAVLDAARPRIEVLNDLLTLLGV